MQPVIHLVDDDASFRNSMARLLRNSGYEVQTYKCAKLILTSCDTSRPGCMVLDVKMPGLDGLQLQEQMAATDAAMPIVFLTGHGDIEQSVAAMKAGAVDFLTKPVSKLKLLSAIENAIARDKRLKERRSLANECHSRLGALTPREKQVFERVVQGKMNKQIAYTLGTSERTIKAHRKSIMSKLSVNSIAELVSFSEKLNALANA